MRKISLFWNLVLVCITTCLASRVSLAQDVVTSAETRWNIASLKETPKMRWLSETGVIRTLLYTGQPMNGHETEVFAFYASPKTLGEVREDRKFPGIVLIHGGGGTAFADWTWMWAKRGYAAIAMDLSGNRPIDPIFNQAAVPVPKQAANADTRTKLPLGGPALEHSAIFESIGGDVSDDWPYHAIGNAILAHSLLRSFPEVMADRTAVTGISWGGYTTCIVASLDDRFCAAVPVYGCGFLYEGESVQKGAIDQLGDRRDKWIEAYDPSKHLPKCRVPIFFVNGTNDVHYPLDSYQKSYDAVLCSKRIRIEVDMKHGHTAGWTPSEIGWYVDSQCRDGTPLPTIGDIAISDNQIHASFQSALPLTKAKLHYTSDNGIRSNRVWKSLDGVIGNEKVTTPKPPQDANTWFISVTDQRDAMVTSAIRFEP